MLEKKKKENVKYDALYLYSLPSRGIGRMGFGGGKLEEEEEAEGLKITGERGGLLRTTLLSDLERLLFFSIFLGSFLSPFF